MVRNQRAVSDASPSRPRRESFSDRGPSRGRGRGRGRGGYTKRMDYDQRPQRNSRNPYSSNSRGRNEKSRGGRRSDYGTSSPPRKLEDRINMGQDMYEDEEEVDGEEAASAPDRRPLEERISLPNDGKNGGYENDVENDEEAVENLDGSNDARKAERDSENGPRSSEERTGSVGSEQDSSKSAGALSSGNLEGDENSNMPDAPGSSKKDPEELRQKVFESLAEKKKKAAVFMNMEAEGAIKRDQLNDTKVDALLATFGTNKTPGAKEQAEPKPEQRRSRSDPTIENIGDERGRKHDPEASSFHIKGAASHDHSHGRYDQYREDDSSAPHSARSDKPRPKHSPEYIRRDRDEFGRPKDAYAQVTRSRTPSRHNQHGDYRNEIERDDRDRRESRQDSRHRYERYEGTPKDPRYSTGRGAPSIPADRKKPHEPRYSYPEDEHPRTRSQDYYRDPEIPREPRAKETYDPPPKPTRRMPEPSLPEMEYKNLEPEYPVYPSGRVVAPREDPRYPPVSRPPETDYAALYYSDLTEWLEITGYHDFNYRQMHILRQREIMRAREESSRRYAIEEVPESQRYVGRPQVVAPREDPDPRARASSMYNMGPPPPPSSAPWDDRDAGKRSIPGEVPHSSPRTSAYAQGPLPEERSRHIPVASASPSTDKSVLKRRISMREGDYGDDSRPLSKAPRHSYEGIHRQPSGTYSDESGSTMHRSSAIEAHHRRPDASKDIGAVDETEAVRQSLSRRLAATRGRDTSPGRSTERFVQRSLSPPRPGFKRDYVPNSKPRYAEKERTPDASPRFAREPYKGPSPASAKFPPRDDFRKPFNERRNSVGEYRTPNTLEPRGSLDDFKRRPYGRGRGRGYAKDYPPYDRQERYERRNNHEDTVDVGNIAPYPIDLSSESTRYFMIKSFNQDNVRMAQTDNIWATQQKNSEILEQAFRSAQDVVLFFSINKSGKFQGYARMETAPGSAPVPSWAKNLLWESSGPFRIRWITIADISFHRVAHLKNHLNEGQPVLIGRDGQEIDPDCGNSLCKIFDETAAFRAMHDSSRNERERDGI